MTLKDLKNPQDAIESSLATQNYPKPTFEFHFYHQ